LTRRREPEHDAFVFVRRRRSKLKERVLECGQWSQRSGGAFFRHPKIGCPLNCHALLFFNYSRILLFQTRGEEARNAERRILCYPDVSRRGTGARRRMHGWADQTSRRRQLRCPCRIDPSPNSTTPPAPAPTFQLVRWERGQNAPAAAVGESVVRTRATKGRVDGTSTPGCDASHRRVAGVAAFLLRSFSAKCEGISTTFPFSTHCSGLVSIECPVVRRTDASGCFHAC
jgi:hypothetical protein